MIRICDSDAEHNDTFMARVWPHYNAPLGIEWVEIQRNLRAEDEAGRTVGVANYVIIGGLGELRQILVEPDIAHGGVGSALLQAFERDCRERACHKLRLETADYQARGFYEKHGWQLRAELPDDRFHRTWLVMEKVLESGAC